jgi:protein phosphatase 1G
MGVLLSTPVTEKESETGEAGKIKYAACSMQGWRKTMEDAHIAQLDVNQGQCSVFGVYDGHGGREVAKYVEKHLLAELVQTESFKNGDYAKALIETYLLLDKNLDKKDVKLELYEISEKSNAEEPNSNDLLSRIASLIENSSPQRMQVSQAQPSTQIKPVDTSLNQPLTTTASSSSSSSEEKEKENSKDEKMEEEDLDMEKAKEIIKEKKKMEEEKREIDVNFVRCGIYSGTTAVTTIVTDSVIVVANSGDSRCILSRNGKVIEMSHDHKPMNKEECARIYKAGSFVQNARVNGDLALSRAIGDTQYKTNKDLPPEEQAVTVYPEIEMVERTAEDEFIVIACDGIWDVKTNQEVLDFVKAGLTSGLEPTKIAENLLDSCIAKDPTGMGTDNMTAIIILLNQNPNPNHQ